MKANGFGRSTVGKWIQIPSSQKHHTQQNHKHTIHSNVNMNPYEVLSDSSIHNLTKMILPNGETIFSSFNSIEEISTYFSNIPFTSTNKTKLVQLSLNKKQNVKESTPAFKRTQSNTTNIYLSKFYNDKNKMKDNPQTPDNFTQTDTQLYKSTRLYQIRQPSMPVSSLSTTIENFYKDINYDKLNIYQARAHCKRIGALLFITMEEWLEIIAMNLEDLKETLVEFETWNKENMEKEIKGELIDLRDMKYEDILTIGDDFQLQQIYYASDLTLRQILRVGIEHYSFSFEKNIIELPRADLIFEIYKYLAQVIEKEGLTKNSVIICPPTQHETIQTIIQQAVTPKKDQCTSTPNPKQNKYKSPMKTISPRIVSSIKKRRVYSPISSPTSMDISEDIKNEKVTIEDNIERMLILKTSDISKMSTKDMEPLIKSFNSKTNANVENQFFTKTPVKLMQDHLLCNVLELHSYYTPSQVNDSTPDTFIHNLTPIQAYNEYFIMFNKGTLKFHDIIKIELVDIKTQLIEFLREKNKSLDTTMDDVTAGPVTQPNESKPILMLDKHDNTEISKLYERVIGYHENNDCKDDDIAENIITILGLLTEDDLNYLTHEIVRTFVRIIYRYSEIGLTDEQILDLKIGFCRAFLKEERKQLLRMSVNKKLVPLEIKNLKPQCTRLLSRSQIQILLYRIYATTTNPYAFPFPYPLEALKCTLAIIITSQDIKDNTAPTTPKSDEQKNQTHTTDKKITNEKFRTLSENEMIYITVTASSTDNDIDKMSYNNMCKEVYRIQSPTDSTLTLERLNKKTGHTISTELKLLRNNMKKATLDPKNEFLLTSETTDENITLLNQDQIRFAISQYAKERNVVADDIFLSKMTVQQLQIEVRKIRDAIKKGSKEITIPILVRTSNGLKSQKELTQNLRGTDISNFDLPSYDNAVNENQQKNKDRNDVDKGYAAVATKEEIIMIHASIETGSTNQHATPFIHKFVQELYKGDNMLKVVPVNETNFTPSDKLDGVKNIPDDEDKLSKWFTNIRAFKTKLSFTMKITTVNLKNVRSVIFAWCKGKGHWINFTSLAATQKFFGGWFYKLSPYYHNLDHFEEYIYRHAPNLKGKLDIYQKQIYNWTAEKKRVFTVGIVLDGDLEVKNEAFKFLYEHKWGERYDQISFIPYKTNEVLTKEDQTALIISNNKFNKSLARIIIDVKNPTTEHMIENQPTTFQNWLYRTTINNVHLILGVEIIKENVVRVFFDKGDLNQVKHAIHNLYKVAEMKFGASITSNMLDETRLRKAKSSNETEIQYANKLKQINGNPQEQVDIDEHSKPAEQKSRVYFGSYVEVAKNNLTQTSEITEMTEDIEYSGDIKSVITKLTQCYNELKNNMETTISTTVGNIVDEKIKPIQVQVNKIQTNHERKYENLLTEMKDNTKATNSKYEKIIALLEGRAQAPSDATRSPGVGK